MKPQTAAEAIATLEDLSRSTLDRETAIHFLYEHNSPEAIEALVRTLHDDDFGVRWAAAKGLAHAGDTALVPLLQEIISHGSERDLREAAHRVLSQNVSPQVRAETQDLQKAMKGPSADLATPEAAFKLLKQVTR